MDNAIACGWRASPLGDDAQYWTPDDPQSPARRAPPRASGIAVTFLLLSFCFRFKAYSSRQKHCYTVLACPLPITACPPSPFMLPA